MNCSLSEFRFNKLAGHKSMSALGGDTVVIPPTFQITSANQITSVQFNPYMNKIVEQLLQIREKLRDDNQLVLRMTSIQGLRELFYKVIVRGVPDNSELSALEVVLQAITTEGIQALQKLGIRLCNKLASKIEGFLRKKFPALGSFLASIFTRIATENFGTGDFCTGLVEAITETATQAFGGQVNKLAEEYLGAEILDLRTNQQKLYGSILSEEQEISVVLDRVAKVNLETVPVVNTGGGALPPLSDFSGGESQSDGLSKKDLLLFGGAGILALSAVMIATSRRK